MGQLAGKHEVLAYFCGRVIHSFGGYLWLWGSAVLWLQLFWGIAWHHFGQQLHPWVSWLQTANCHTSLRPVDRAWQIFGFSRVGTFHVLASLTCGN